MSGRCDDGANGSHVAVFDNKAAAQSPGTRAGIFTWELTALVIVFVLIITVPLLLFATDTVTNTAKSRQFVGLCCVVLVSPLGIWMMETKNALVRAELAFLLPMIAIVGLAIVAINNGS